MDVIYHEELEKKINEYAIEKIYEILEKYTSVMSEEALLLYSSAIINNKIVIVDLDPNKDEIFFNGKVPLAHGPRTKEDGFIHIYPYLLKTDNIDEIVDYYDRNNIILHELYHFLIKLDFESTRIIEEEFGHYINEGMVELYAENHSKRKGTSDYERNVEAASLLYDSISGNKDEIIFNHNFKNLLDKNPNLEVFIDNYQKEIDFLNEFKRLICEISTIIKLDIKDVISSYSRLTISEIIERYKEDCNSKLSADDAKKYIDLLNEKHDKIYNQKEKKLF